MALGPRLDLRQSQSLVMTPQLQQAIKLLALSNLELETYIAEEVEKNPLLEIGGDDGPNDAESEIATPDLGQAATDVMLGDDASETGGSLDVDFTEETFHHDSAADGGPGLDGTLGLNGASNGASGFEDGLDLDGFAANAPSL